MSSLPNPATISLVTDDELRKVLYYALHSMGQYFENLQKENLKIKNENTTNNKKRKIDKVDDDDNLDEKISKKVLETCNAFNWSAKYIKDNKKLTAKELKQACSYLKINTRNDQSFDKLFIEIEKKENPNRNYDIERITDIGYDESLFFKIKYLYFDEVEAEGLESIDENSLKLVAICFLQKLQSNPKYPLREIIEENLSELYADKWIIAKKEATIELDKKIKEAVEV